MYAYAGRATHVSHTKTLSQHRKMNLQHSLNVNFTRLHTNIPVGTRRLTPTPARFDIVSAHTIRTNSQKNVFIRINFVDVGNTLTIFASTQSACVLKRALLLYE